MFIPEKIVGRLGSKPADLAGYFDKAEIPSESAQWVPAPDPDEIAFGGEEASRLTPQSSYPCERSVDYAYFQTFITPPAGTVVKDFSVDFVKIDDAARISIFNSKHPDGMLGDGSIVDADEQAISTGNLATELVPGEPNRVVITQMDFCSPGNNLGSAKITLNGEDVSVDSDLPEPEVTTSTAAEDTTTTTEAEAVKKRVPFSATWGDVHISTPDGLVYDFQKTGDLLLIQSDSGDAVLQARQVVWSANPKVTVNGGGAMKVAGDKLEFSVTPENAFYLNGAKADIPTSDMTLPSGGTLEVHRPGDLVVFWPNGEFAARVVYRNGYLDLGVARLGGTATYEGVLGNLDKDPSNDMQIRGGDQIAVPASDQQLTEFADSWKVSKADSLFMQPAADPEPTPEADAAQPQLTLADLPEADTNAAESTCKDAGISEALALANCTYDVAATGDEAFVESAKTFQEDVEALPAGELQYMTALKGAAPVKSPTPASDDDSSSNSGLLIGGGILLLVVIIGGAVLMSKNKKQSQGQQP